MDTDTTTLQGLNQAQQLAQADPGKFPQVLQFILPMAANPTTSLPVKQWCASFLQQWFSPEIVSVPFHVKQGEVMKLLPVLIALSEVQDVSVYRNVILTMTSIYEMVFDLVAKTINSETWAQMTNLKMKVVQKWTTSWPLAPKNPDSDRFRSVGCKIAAAKFIAKVIVVQSPGSTAGTDPRRRGNTSGSSSTSEISISSIQANHPVLNRVMLDAECKALLDALLDYFKEESYLVSPVFISVLNNMIFVMQKRKSFGPKILHEIAQFDIMKKYQYPKDEFLKYKLNCRFAERAIKNALNYSNRAGLINSQSSVSQKFQKMVSAINSKHEEHKKKGILNQIPGEVPNKKASEYLPFAFDDTAIKDNAYSSLYQLIDSSNELIEFDVSAVPTQVLSNISIAALAKVDAQKLIQGLSIISQRYADLVGRANPNAAKAELKEEEDALKRDDNDNDQILADGGDDNLETTFVLPPPKTMTAEAKKRHLGLIVENFFNLSKVHSDSKALTAFNLNKAEDVDNSVRISKVAINDWKKNSWLILLTRLATRGLKTEDGELSDLIRQAIYDYFLESIHDRIDIVIEWLNEEWFAEFNSADTQLINDPDAEIPTPIYLQWTAKVLDSMIPFLEANDRKIFIRLLSDLPYLNGELVERVKSLCIDPLRSKIGFQSLQFLIMFRPPVRQACILILRDLYAHNDDLKENARNLLVKYDNEFKDDEKIGELAEKTGDEAEKK